MEVRRQHPRVTRDFVNVISLSLSLKQYHLTEIPAEYGSEYKYTKLLFGGCDHLTATYAKSTRGGRGTGGTPELVIWCVIASWV